MGHLLLGDNSHIPVGIMRANWRPVEIKQALMGVLTFTSRQAEQMRGDAQRRMEAGRSALPGGHEVDGPKAAPAEFHMLDANAQDGN